MEIEMEIAVLALLGKCIRSLAPIADKNLKFPSSPTVQDLFIAGIATRNEDRRDIKNID
ncbi:MAG: hypothetical protein V3V92_06015 [Candidatus Hydrothermarchaeales archaeon]